MEISGPKNDQIVTPREFAMKLGLKPSAVYQLFKMGRLEGFQLVQRGSIRIWLHASTEKLQQSGVALDDQNKAA